MTIRYVKVFLFDVFHHRAFRQSVDTPLANHLFLSGIHAEEEIQDNSYDWHEEQYENPQQRLYWLSIIHHDGNYRAYHNNRINKGGNPIKISHFVYNIMSVKTSYHLNPANLWVCKDNRHLG